MNYDIVYQVTQDNNYKLSLLLDLFAVVICILGFVLVIKVLDFNKFQKSLSIVVLSILFIAFTINFIAGIYVNFYVNEKYVVEPYKREEFCEVEGVVKGIEWTTLNGLDKFCVNDISFIISEKGTVGYNVKAYKGGIIQEGKHLRIRYVVLNDKKIIVEIAIPINSER